MQNKKRQLNFYSLFTQYSLMDDYGFASGLTSRLFRKVLPPVPEEGTVDYYLLGKKNAVAEALQLLDFEHISSSYIAIELDRSIKALGSKVAAFGMDNNMQAKFHFLGINAECFEVLLRELSSISPDNEPDISTILESLTEIDGIIFTLRERKREIGINLHLTVVTRRILEYIERLRELIELKANLKSRTHWEAIFSRHIQYSKEKNSIRAFIRRHSDLLAFEIVEHTSSKGEKYIADSRHEYWNFFRKSALGGALIACFALFKIILDGHGYGPLQSALVFSINYALCFVLVKQVGGIIATKQPAMTASTIAKNVDKDGDLVLGTIQEINVLIRKVFRSQFISLVGNFVVALLFACIIAKCLHWFDLSQYDKAIKPSYLLKTVKPSLQLVSFAATAGVFLALTGLISGYFDNKVVASKIAYRINNNKWWLKSKLISSFVEKNAGALLGNISLGFFLGCSFLLSNVLPFSVDIRHIAFSSANLGYALMNNVFDLQTILLSLVGVVLIGLTNFLVSFSITLFLALKSRGATIKLLPKLLMSTLLDFFRKPMGYFYFTSATDDD